MVWNIYIYILFGILLRVGNIPIYPTPTSHMAWHGLCTWQILKKLCCTHVWMEESIMLSVHVPFLCQCSGLAGLLPGSSSPCWPWDLGVPPWAGWGAPQALPAAHCRRSGARSVWDKSQMSSADSQWAGKLQLTCCAEEYGSVFLNLKRTVSPGDFWLKFKSFIPSQQGPRLEIYVFYWFFIDFQIWGQYTYHVDYVHLNSFLSPALCPGGPGLLHPLLSGFCLCLAYRRYEQEVGEGRSVFLPGTGWPFMSTAPVEWPLFQGSNSHGVLLALPSLSTSFLPHPQDRGIKASLCC